MTPDRMREAAGRLRSTRRIEDELLAVELAGEAEAKEHRERREELHAAEEAAREELAELLERIGEAEHTDPAALLEQIVTEYTESRWPELLEA